MPSEPIAGSKKAQKIRQACDCCHARKIRCDGEKPCKNCQVTELQCTYLAIPKKKGPKGRRIAKDVKPVALQRPKIFEHSSNGQPAATGERQPIYTASRGTETNDFSLFNILNPTPNILSPESGPTVAFSSSADDNASTFRASPLFTPIMPVLDKEITYAMVPHLNEMPEKYGMVAALCALIVFQPEIIDAPQLGSPWPSSQDLINEAVRARGFCDHIEKPSLTSIHTSFFLYAALFCLGKDNSAWFYIRESMTMLQLLRLHEEGTYEDLDAEYSKYFRRTFWLLFITERGYALQRHRPLTLQLTIDLPTVDPGPEATILSGFLDLVSLFQHFDETFMTLWNMSGSDSSPQALIQLQEILKTAIPEGSDRTEIQQADLRVSRQWLRTLVWQLCVSKGLLSSQSSDESMSFQYPISIARDVVQVARSLPIKAFEANGVGLLEKVFDIGCSLSDVLLLNPDAINGSSMEIGPRDYLLEMARLLGTTPGGDKYLRMLTLKSDGFMQLRLRGSLSDSEASDRIEEIFDEEENLLPEQSDVQYPGYNETLIEGNFAAVDQLGVENFEAPPVSMMMGDPSLAFSMPTPGWDAFWPPSAPDVD
ncbi:RING-3 [Cadophora sp. MPI-SDFR-AT-0126]|nr:RING-3 [Leotiomycetes sp. MPI-SDFR-AT-0126]